MTEVPISQVDLKVTSDALSFYPAAKLLCADQFKLGR
jgi:hypothetical protein